jgi:hypothetical protein
MLAWPEGKILVVEIRDADKKTVSFSAFDYSRNNFLWRDKTLEESWWINASAIIDGVILFTTYLDTNNPDKKAVLAYSVSDLKLKWWNNDFSISHIQGSTIVGYSSRMGLKELNLDILTGHEKLKVEGEKDRRVTALQKPVQYSKDMEHFKTVRTFLAERLNLTALSALEYLETEKNVIISCYVQEEGLANYLIVLSIEGNVVLKEKIEANVKGIGLDTFFVLDGSLFFVRNKVELVSYKNI